MKQLIDAQTRAIEIISAALGDAETPEDIRKDLKAMSKAQLIDLLMDPNRLTAQIERLVSKREYVIKDIAYDILCDPTCAWLTYDMIAGLMQKYIPGCQTSAKSLAWYSAKQHEHNRDVCARVSMRTITATLLRQHG